MLLRCFFFILVKHPIISMKFILFYSDLDFCHHNFWLLDTEIYFLYYQLINLISPFLLLPSKRNQFIYGPIHKVIVACIDQSYFTFVTSFTEGLICLQYKHALLFVLINIFLFPI